MAQNDRPTISIMAPGPSHSLKPIRSTDAEEASRRLLRNVGIVLLLLVVGWGAWRFNGAATTTVEEESVADLDGFESGPQLKSPQADHAATARSSKATSLPTPNPHEKVTWDLGKLIPPETNDMAEPANAWLTGTIEATESTEKIELPGRLSDGSNESSILR